MEPTYISLLYHDCTMESSEDLHPAPDLYPTFHKFKGYFARNNKYLDASLGLCLNINRMGPILQ